MYQVIIRCSQEISLGTLEAVASTINLSARTLHSNVVICFQSKMLLSELLFLSSINEIMKRFWKSP